MSDAQDKMAAMFKGLADRNEQLTAQRDALREALHELHAVVTVLCDKSMTVNHVLDKTRKILEGTKP
jgi:hypothetical protein